MAESSMKNMLGPFGGSRGETESGGEGFLPGPNDIVIAIMGETGSGKTTFIQHFKNDPIEIEHGLESGKTDVYLDPQHVRFVRCYLPDGTTFYLIDTPSLDITFHDDDRVLEDIARWLCKAYISKNLLMGVIYLQRIDVNRITRSNSDSLRMLKSLCGISSMVSVYLATTMWDKVILETGQTREEVLVSPHMFGSRVFRQDAGLESATTIVQSLIYRNLRVVLQIQAEMVDEDMSLDQTTAWKELEAQRHQTYNGETEKVQEQMSEALVERAMILKKELVDFKAVIEGRMRKYGDEQHEKQRANEEEAQNLLEGQLTVQRHLEFQQEYQVRIKMSTYMMTPGSFSIYSMLDLSWETVQRLFRPRVRDGYKRVEWRCTCGELRYGDFKETSSGSLEKLAANLWQHSGQSSQQGSSTIPQNPSNVQARQGVPLVGWKLPNRNQGNSSSTASRATTTSPSNPTPPPRKALQLCVETGKFTIELSELDLKQPYSDGMLFQMIRAKYESVRQSILPMRLRFRKPEKALFVKFRLASSPLVSPVAGSVDKPAIPPEAEVQAGNYEYTPCPIEEPPIDSRTFFHHFYSPASKHPASMWGERLPWKVGPSLVVPMSQGWGIQLEEQPDWPLFFAFMFFILLVSGLVAGIYAWQTKDHQTGVAIGAWLTTVQAMGMSAVFFWWT